MMAERIIEVIPNNYSDGIMPGDKLTPLFRMGIHHAIEEAKAKGLPIARYDDAIKKAYLEYPDGIREYVATQSNANETHAETESAICRERPNRPEAGTGCKSAEDLSEEEWTGRTKAERVKVFVAGSRAVTQLNQDIRNRLLSVVENSHAILIGDANGADRLVQEFLFAQKYQRVVVYASNGVARNNLGQWPIKDVPVGKDVKGFAFYACKDKQMANDADYGFMIWNGKSKGTLNNIMNLTSNSKKVLIYYIPLKRFYCLDSVEQTEQLVKGCGRETQKFFRSLSKG